MACMTVVSVSVRGPGLDDLGRDIEFGEFGSVWMANGVLIGSDPRCDVVLPELPPVAARVAAAADHELLCHLVANLPQSMPRVDDGAFDLGPYSIRFSGVVREA